MPGRLGDGRIKFRHLQCFLAVAQFASIKRAADSLSITQPAVSKTIAELEEILGVALFERSRSGAALTREGQIFVPHVSACVAALREGVELLTREGGGDGGTIAMGVLPTVAVALIPRVLPGFRKRWPRAILSVRTGLNAELLARLKAREVEFAIARVADPELMVGLSFEHLYSEPLSVVVRDGHPLIDDGAAAATRLTEFPVVLPPYGTLIRHRADTLLSAYGAAPLPSFVEALSVSVGRAIVLENDGVWFVPSSAVRHDLATGTIVRLPLPTEGTEEPVGIVVHTDVQPSPVVLSLLDMIRSAMRRAE
jgi:LysR family transcriptional regulator, pca operon transcriptional activator